MEELKSAINWFEIPATDFDRAVRFYSTIYALIDDTEGNRVYLHSMN
jgi:predicted enzyme related to lactoylglutathione lyase